MCGSPSDNTVTPCHTNRPCRAQTCSPGLDDDVPPYEAEQGGEVLCPNTRDVGSSLCVRPTILLAHTHTHMVPDRFKGDFSEHSTRYGTPPRWESTMSARLDFCITTLLCLHTQSCGPRTCFSCLQTYSCVSMCVVCECVSHMMMPCTDVLCMHVYVLCGVSHMMLPSCAHRCGAWS